MLFGTLDLCACDKHSAGVMKHFEMQLKSMSFFDTSPLHTLLLVSLKNTVHSEILKPASADNEQYLKCFEGNSRMAGFPPPGEV